jgi:hypothetical protein
VHISTASTEDLWQDVTPRLSYHPLMHIGIGRLCGALHGRGLMSQSVLRQLVEPSIHPLINEPMCRCAYCRSARVLSTPPDNGCCLVLMMAACGCGKCAAGGVRACGSWAAAAAAAVVVVAILCTALHGALRRRHVASSQVCVYTQGLCAGFEGEVVEKCFLLSSPR